MIRFIQRVQNRIFKVTTEGKLIVERAESRQPMYERLRALVLPQNFPDSVKQPFYWRHCQWTMVEGFLGSVVGVFTTQSMLSAMLMSRGYDVMDTNYLPYAAATLNWVIKDGLGQLGGIVFVSLMGNRFDLHPKQFRFLSGFVLKMAMLVELMTPLFPRMFLVLAALCTAAKNVSWMACSASRAPLLKLLGKGNNLGDLTGKAASQLTITSMLGMATGVGISEALTMLRGKSDLIGYSMISVPLLVAATGALWLSCKWTISNRLHPLQIAELLKKPMSPEEYASVERIVHPRAFSHKLERIVFDAPLNEFLSKHISCSVQTEKHVVLRIGELIYVWLLEGAGDEDALKAIIEAIRQRDSNDVLHDALHEAVDLKELGWSADGLSQLFRNRLELYLC